VPHLACASGHACCYRVTHNLSECTPSDLDTEVTEPGPVVRPARPTLADP